MGCLKLHKEDFYTSKKGVCKLYVSYKKSCTDDYRFGFNGQEKVNEIAGVGNHNTALFWEYDTRLGRRWNLDPVDQINISNYAVNQNNPIQFTDPNGDCSHGNGCTCGGNKQAFVGNPFPMIKPVTAPQIKPLNPIIPKTPIPKPVLLPSPNPFVVFAIAMLIPISAGPSGMKTTSEQELINNIKSKPLAPPLNKEDDDDFASVRFQVQTGNANISSTTEENTKKEGVTKTQGYGALGKIYFDATTKDPSLLDNSSFKSAIIKTSLKIKSIIGGVSRGVYQTTIQEKFIHNKKIYRIDVEVQRGVNFKK